MNWLYKNLKYIILAEFITIFILDKLGVAIQSDIGNAIGALLFLLPIELLVYLASKDEKFSQLKRYIFKLIFYFIIICYISPTIIKIVE